MKYKNKIKLFIITCIICPLVLQSQSIEEMYATKINHIDQVASLNVITFYNRNEKNLLVNAIDECRTWLEPKISNKMKKVQENNLLSENQGETIRIMYGEYKEKKDELEKNIEESPAFGLGTGFTRTQWSKIHRSAKSLLETEHEFLLYLNELQTKLDAKAKEIELEKKRKDKADNEPVISKNKINTNNDENPTGIKEPDIYKYTTFTLLLFIGLWLYFRFRNNS